MAQRRMFSLKVTSTDHFLDMPLSTQCLYFHLGLAGDDAGFVSAPKKIMRSIGCNDDDLRLLIQKGYVIPFQSGIVVIVDWYLNNTLQSDRVHDTIYQDERALLCRDSAGRYMLGTETETLCIQNGTKADTEDKLREDKVREDIITGENAPAPRGKRFKPPTVDEVRSYCKERGNGVDAEHFVAYYSARNWMMGKTPMKNWKSAVVTWEKNEKGKKPERVYTHSADDF